MSHQLTEDDREEIIKQRILRIVFRIMVPVAVLASLLILAFTADEGPTQFLGKSGTERWRAGAARSGNH